MKYVIIQLLAGIIAVNALAQNVNPKTGLSWGFPDIDSLSRVLYSARYVPFDVTTLDGKRLTNESCKGKVTFINFWFMFCQPCREEFGKLNDLYDSLKNDTAYQFVAISFDPKEALPEFIRKAGIHYPVATVGDKAESKRLNYGMGYPGSIIIDKYGRIRFIAMKGIAEKEGPYKMTLPSVLAIMKKLR